MIEPADGSSRTSWTITLGPEGAGTRLRARHRDDLAGGASRLLAFLRGGRDVELREFLDGVKLRAERPEDAPGAPLI
jgi:hypothetical protein